MFQDGDKTTYVKNSMIDLGYDSQDDIHDVSTLLSYIDNLSDETLFKDGMIKLCKSHGYEGADDIISVRKFIIKRAIEENVITSETKKSFEASLGNWLNEGQVKIRKEKGKEDKIETIGAPSDNVDSRNNVYKLCFALCLNKEEVEEFFLKKYLCRPFNFRNLRETVYYYCFENGHNFLKAIELLGKMEENGLSENTKYSGENVYTASFVNGIEGISNDLEFIDYCLVNKSFFSRNSVASIETVEELIDYCLADLEDAGETKMEGEVAPILDALFTGGIKRRRRRKGKNSDIEEAEELENPERPNIKELERMPKKIRTNFPSEEQISKVRRGNDEGAKLVSSDAMRRIIIMLHFFDYFKQRESEGYNKNDYLAYWQEIDGLLDNCGFIQTYARNPYDWIFLFCSRQDDPLDTFVELIRDYVELSNDI